MKVFADFIEIESSIGYNDITSEVEKIVAKSGIKNGIVAIHEMHTTAAIIVNENDADLHEDTKDLLNEIVPVKEYRHNYEGNENAAAHIKSQLLGCNAILPVINGKLALGTWQSIFFMELFEKRRRKIAVVAMGE